MALNLQTLRTRFLSSVVFVAVMLAGLLWNHWSFFILFSIIHFGCWVEYQKLVGLIDKEYQQISVFHKYGVMIAGWCCLLFFTNDAFRIGNLSLHPVGWWLGLILIFVLPIIEILFAKEVVLKNIGYSVLGLLYISLSFGLMIHIRSTGIEWDETLRVTDRGYIIPCGLIFSIWINDTMAYIVGSLIGQTPFSSISPKKTWEGTIGGAILCILIITWLGSMYGYLSAWQWFGVATIAAVFGTSGDLLESKLKRMASVKDSGSMMPGHGGFLDRFDSLLIAIPFVWLFLSAAGKI